MENYKNAHRWLILAFVIVVLGFFRSYWSKFPDVDFAHHLHLLSATAWFALLVWQPRLATTGRLRQHRRNGMIGLFLAGAVVGTSLLMVPRNIENAVAGIDVGFVDPTFFYGISFFDLVTVAGFSLAVIMAILTARRPEDHALWMISTAFWIIGPAFARLAVLPVVMIRGNLEGLQFFDIIVPAMGLVLAVIAFVAWRMKRLHPALVLAFLGNTAGFVAEPIGDWEPWRNFCEAVLLRPSD